MIMGCAGPHIITEVVSKLAAIKNAVDETRPTVSDAPDLPSVFLHIDKPTQAKAKSSPKPASAVKPSDSAQRAPKRTRLKRTGHPRPNAPNSCAV